ncbi:hypothetical protein O181_052687 [Austropuccinia psidii MF-1]|uniref:Uncharacterized protein n=1 Tax=Austropuccinia psidii MF-1 TaxID=1389203 RepID=A0A9Q3E867_9BASI|nr:hypothetical protein [Austropuccinia psidii MF-1]
MPVQHTPPAKSTRSQTNPAVLTPTARDPLDRTQSVHQLSANLDRGPPMEGEAPSRRGGMKSRKSRSFSGLLGGCHGMSEGARASLGEVEDEEGEDFVEEEDSGETEVADAFANAPEVPQGSNLTPINLIQFSSRQWSKWLLSWDNSLKKLPPGKIPKPLHSRLHQ